MSDQPERPADRPANGEPPSDDELEATRPFQAPPPPPPPPGWEAPDDATVPQRPVPPAPPATPPPPAGPPAYEPPSYQAPTYQAPPAYEPPSYGAPSSGPAPSYGPGPAEPAAPTGSGNPFASPAGGPSATPPPYGTPAGPPPYGSPSPQQPAPPYGAAPYGAPPYGGYAPPLSAEQSALRTQAITSLVINICAIFFCLGLVSIAGAACAAIALGKVNADTPGARKLVRWSWGLLAANLLLYLIGIGLIVALALTVESSTTTTGY